jgi:hypothetical protein
MGACLGSGLAGGTGGTEPVHSPRLTPPPQPGIALAVDMVTLLEGLVTHLGRHSAVEFYVLIGAQAFQNGIEALPRPWQELTKPGDGDPRGVGAEALIGRVELLALGVRLSEPCQLLLGIEPVAQGFAYGCVA